MTCTACGWQLAATDAICGKCGEPARLSDPDASLDQMVQRASVPTLATLFRRAKATGAIQAVSVYGEGAPS